MYLSIDVVRKGGPQGLVGTYQWVRMSRGRASRLKRTCSPRVLSLFAHHLSSCSVEYLLEFGILFWINRAVRIQYLPLEPPLVHLFLNHTWSNPERYSEDRIFLSTSDGLHEQIRFGSICRGEDFSTPPYSSLFGIVIWGMVVEGKALEGCCLNEVGPEEREDEDGS